MMWKITCRAIRDRLRDGIRKDSIYTANVYGTQRSDACICIKIENGKGLSCSHRFFDKYFELLTCEEVRN